MRVIYDRAAVAAWDPDTLGPAAPVPPSPSRSGGIQRRSGLLRNEVNARNRTRAAAFAHETTYGSQPSVVYQPDETGAHGNFFPASYRRICARVEWRERLNKRYTASRRIARGHERRHAELDCASSSDALLMNIFCHPTALRSAALRALLAMTQNAQPEFGFHPRVPLTRGLLDRTEIDMRIGDLLMEAKLTEFGFGNCRASLIERYPTFETVFEASLLPRTGDGAFACYQLLRSVLAAVHLNCRFALLCDDRRPDLQEDWLSVARAVRTADDRSRMLLVTWQEIAACLPTSLRQFLAMKYGIGPSR